MRLAYSFEDDGQRGHVHRGRHAEPGQQRLAEVVRQWNELWRTSRPVLRARDEGRVLRIDDSRPCADERSWTTDELQAEVCRVCDVAQTRDTVMKEVSARRGAEASDVAAAIETLCEHQVLLPLNGRLLSLPVWV